MRRTLIPLPRRGQTVGERLRRLREYRNYTQRRLADYANLAQATVARTETNFHSRTPRPETLEALAHALGVGSRYFDA